LLHETFFIYALMIKSKCKRATFVSRADWFLLDSRAVRHVAIGLFCMGVSVYLAGKKMVKNILFC